jgi:hypothetical protein
LPTELLCWQTLWATQLHSRLATIL